MNKVQGMEYIEGKVVYFEIDEDGERTYIKDPHRYHDLMQKIRKVMRDVVLFSAGLAIGRLI